MQRNIPAYQVVALFIAILLLPAVLLGQSKGLASRGTANFRFRYDRSVRAEDIRKIGKEMEAAYIDCSGRLGLSLHRKVDVYAFSSPGRFRTDSRSGVYDDAAIRDGKIYLSVGAVLKSDTSRSNPIARSVSEAILNELKWCPRWVAEIYGIYAGRDLSRFGSPAQLTASTFSDLSEDYARAVNSKDLTEVHAKLAATARFFVDRYGEKKLERLYLQFVRPATLDDAFEAAFGEKLPVIEKAWAAALRSPSKG